MGFWSRLFGLDGIAYNENGDPDLNPGDPDGFQYIQAEPTDERAGLPNLYASAWDGWPTGWQTPNWNTGSGASAGVNRLIDIAWACLDLNSNVISSMPCYQLKDGRIIKPETWMLNPDETIYTSWPEFAKQMFWDFMMGEVFIMPMAVNAEGYPSRFRVIPPWAFEVTMAGSERRYKLGTMDVTGEVLHIRYKSLTTEPRGVGPLEVAGARQTAIGLLQRYANSVAESGGVPLYWMSLNRRITESEGRDVLDRWIESRAKYAGHPALVANGAELHQANSMSARDMTLLELSQFNESRIAVLMGVPPFLVGLAGAAGSLTYSNIADLFDFHDRSSLRPKVRMGMEALSSWALPNGRSVELNRDDYTRLPFDKRMAAYKIAIEMKVLTPDEIRIMERFYGEGSTTSAQALTGGTD